MVDNYLQYWLAVKREIWKVLLISVAVSLLAYAIAVRVGPSHQAHFSYLVSLSEREEGADYRFDGYYAISATDLFASTLAAWARAPEVIAEVYDRAEVEWEGDDPRQLVKSITADKTAPQLVEITVRHSNPEVVQAWWVV